MFIGAYFGLCGFQYLIVVAVSVILLGRKPNNPKLLKFLGRYTLVALGCSLLGLVLFILASIPIGNLQLNFPKDLTDPARAACSLVVMSVVLLGLVGVTAPVWILLLLKPGKTTDL